MRRITSVLELTGITNRYSPISSELLGSGEPSRSKRTVQQAKRQNCDEIVTLCGCGPTAFAGTVRASNSTSVVVAKLGTATLTPDELLRVSSQQWRSRTYRAETGSNGRSSSRRHFARQLVSGQQLTRIRASDEAACHADTFLLARRTPRDGRIFSEIHRQLVYIVRRVPSLKPERFTP